jgi:hypothetical protein
MIRPSGAPVAPPAPAGPKRRRLLVGIGTGVAVLVVGGAGAAAFLLTSHGATKAPLAEQAAPLVAPVSADLSALNDDLSTPLTANDLSSVRADASRLGSSAATAVSTMTALQLASSDQSAGRQLITALQATARYGRSVASAAVLPSATSIARAQADATDARTAFAVVEPNVPRLALPAGDQFTVAAIATYAGKKKAGEKAAAARSAQARTYVSRIDSLLANSADTRGNLGQLITGVQSGTLTPAEAKSQIAGILNQRQDLQNSVSLVEAPGSFAHAQELLRSSLSAAIADDMAIQSLIDAWETGDTYGMDSFWQQHLAANDHASAAKAEFVQSYNAARATVLRLGPSSVGTGY